MIPESFIENLKYASDIEQIVSSYVSLKRRSGKLIGLCPFHSEKTPSFTVYTDPADPHYYCFGCGSGGDVITFIRNAENLEYIEALRFLAERAGLTLPENAQNDQAAQLKARVLEINRESARFFHQCLTADSGKGALAYLLDRGLGMKTIRTFGLGYSPPGWDSLREHLRSKGFSYEEALAAAVVAKGRNGGVYDLFRGRVMFPIIDLRGNVIGFGGRAMDDNGPKYLNSSDTPVFKKSRNLFALNFAKASKNDTLILGEGYMDVIAMHQAGFTNAVATLGTSLTEEQARLISRYAKRVAIAYDSDNAGQAATKRAINLFSQTDVTVGVIEIKDAKDPDEYIKKFGAARFRNLVESGKGAIEFETAKLKNQFDLSETEGTVAFINAFCKLMAGIDSEIERSVHIGAVARDLDIDKKGIVSTVEAARKQKLRTKQKNDAHNLKVYAQDNAGSRVKPRINGLEGIVAEEKLLTLLMKNPDYYKQVADNLSAEDFSDDDNRAVFSALSQRLQENQPLEMIYLASALSTAQAAKLAGFVAKSVELQFTVSQAHEYIEAIKQQKNKKSVEEQREMPADELFAYSLKQRKHK